MGWIILSAAPLFAEEPDLTTYREECLKGVTIYCIAMGMEEQKAGNLNQALFYYRSACGHHPAHGHLQACTPYLSLARQLGRLDEAVAELESRCRTGEDIVCFYLGKEYLKIAAYPRGYAHLERLCREDFRPPDPQDYGPCYHLGKSLQKTGETGRALKIFKLDCERNRPVSEPSCGRYESLVTQIERGEGIPGGEIKKIEPVETVLLVLVLTPLAGLGLLRYGSRRALRWVRIPLPVVTLLCWAAWVVGGSRAFHLEAAGFVILPAVLLTLLTAWLAHRSL